MIKAYCAIVLVAASLAGCSTEAPSCGAAKTLALLNMAVEDARPLASQMSSVEAVQGVTARFTSIRTLEHDTTLDSYVCEATMEIVSEEQVKLQRSLQYEVYLVEGSEHPVELKYDRSALGATLTNGARIVQTEKIEAAERNAALEANSRREAMLSSLPLDTPGTVERVEQMVAKAANSPVRVRTEHTGTEVSYARPTGPSTLDSGGPFFSGGYPEWNIGCEQIEGQFQCLSYRADDAWTPCVPSIGVSCEGVGDGVIRTPVTPADLRSVLPFLTVKDTLGALEHRYCLEGICYQQGRPVGQMQPQMQEWLGKRCGPHPTAECFK